MPVSKESLRRLLFVDDAFTAAEIGEETVSVSSFRVDYAGFVTDLCTADGRQFTVVRRRDGVWVREHRSPSML